MALSIDTNVTKSSTPAGIANQAISTYGSVTASLQSGSISGLTGTKTPEQMLKDGEIVDYQNGAVRYAAVGGDAEVYIQKNSVVIASDQNTAIGVFDGTFAVDARMHIAKAPHEVTVNGFWVFNEELLTTVPSTLMHPVQTLLFKYPNYAKKAAKLAALLMGA